MLALWQGLSLVEAGHYPNGRLWFQESDPGREVEGGVRKKILPHDLQLKPSVGVPDRDGVISCMSVASAKLER
jgi:hypothetical protein